MNYSLDEMLFSSIVSGAEVEIEQTFDGLRDQLFDDETVETLTFLNNFASSTISINEDKTSATIIVGSEIFTLTLTRSN